MPLIMGILNLTPDSFYVASRVKEMDICVARCHAMLKDGAAIIDLGAQSTRPGSSLVSAEEEWRRLGPVLKELSHSFPEANFSIDTFYSFVAERAINCGASIINDVSGGEVDTRLFDCIASLKVPYILSHIKGTPQNMTQNTHYDDVTRDVVKNLSGKINRLHQLGCADIIIDPGFGFAKNTAQNFELLANLRQLEILEKPVLVGISRKSMIWKTLGVSANEALTGTIALNMMALERGASILRVHDVNEAKETILLYQQLAKYIPN